MTRPTNRAQRRAAVEQALIDQGADLNMSALARRLGVSQDTIRRDIAYMRASWAAGNRDLGLERARTIARYEEIIAASWRQFNRIMDQNPANSAAVGALRTIAELVNRVSQLKGVVNPAYYEEPTEQTLVVEYVVPQGTRPLRIPPPGGDHRGFDPLQDRGDGAAQRQDDPGHHPGQRAGSEIPE